MAGERLKNKMCGEHQEAKTLFAKEAEVVRNPKGQNIVTDMIIKEREKNELYNEP